MNEAGFIQALEADPEDDTTRLVYADWLEERGDLRAAWVRDLAVWRWMGPRAESPIPALMAALAEADWRQAGEIILVLQRVGPAALPALVEALRGSDDLAERASAALQGYRPEDLAPALPLIRGLAREGNVPALRVLIAINSEARAVAPALIERLGHGRQTIRLLAATGPEAGPLLLAEVPHVDSSTLAAIVTSLQEYGDSVAPVLREALTDSDARRRLVAALALAPLDPHAAAPHLVEALEAGSLGSDLEECRVLECLEEVGKAAAPLAVRLRRLLWKAVDRKWVLRNILQRIDDPAALTAELFARLRSERWEERAEAIESLAHLDAPPPGVPEAALAMLTDRDERVRRRALEAIANLGPYGNMDPMTPPPPPYFSPPLLENAIAAVRERFRDDGPSREAIRALAALGAPGLVADLVPLCEHANEELRRTALRTMACAHGSEADAATALCRALDRNEGNAAVDALSERPAVLALAAGEILARVRGDRPSRHHLRLVCWLGLSHDEEAELLCRHLEAGGAVGAEAVEQLSNVFDGRPPVDAMPVLLRLVDEGGQHARSMAALLARMGGPAVPELVRRLKNEKTQEIAAWALGLLGPRAADICPALIEALHLGNDTARSSAASALGNIGPAAAGAVSELRRQARGIFARLRAAAAEALGKIGAKEALPDLRALLTDTDKSVRLHAELAIAKLTREPEEARPEKSDLPVPF